MTSISSHNAVALFARVGSNRTVVVPLNDSAADSRSSLPSFYCAHHLTGAAGATDYGALAGSMEGRVRFFGIQAPPVMMAQPDFGASIETLAARYAATVARFQPRGPLFFGGWSAGAVIALEIAQQMKAEGRDVKLLAAFDGAPKNSGAVISRAYLCRSFVQDLSRRVIGREFWHAVARAAGVFYRYATVSESGKRNLHWAEFRADLHKFPKYQQPFIKRFYDAAQNYVPKRYDGAVVAYEATAQSLTDNPFISQTWGCLASHFEKVRVRGTHYSIIEPPGVKIVADDLCTRIYAELASPSSVSNTRPPNSEAAPR